MKLPSRVALPLLASIAAGCSADSSTPATGATSSTIFVSGASLYGVHFYPGVHGGRVDPRPDFLGGASNPRIWDVELISAQGTDWFLVGGDCAPNTTCEQFRAVTSQNVDLITRLDSYENGHYTVPITDADVTTWQSRVRRVFDNSHGAALSHFARVYIVGNEPNVCGEANGTPPCDSNAIHIDPARYAAAYRAMAPFLHAQASAAGVSDVAALVAGPSGGGWHGLGYLADELSNLCGDTVDGVAIHAYGGADDDPDHDGTFGFSRDVRTQLATIDAACSGRFRNVPVFVTEFSRGERPLTDSDFIFNVYQFLHGWNASGGHNVVAATYFIVGGSGWSYERLLDDSTNNHATSRAAFGRAVAQHWPAGSLGAPAIGTGGSAPPPPPPSTPSCGSYAATHGYVRAACEWNGNGACGGLGPATSDCDHCCDLGATMPPPPPPPPTAYVTCGAYAAAHGYVQAACEWDGNAACGGVGPATSDCDHCCDLGASMPPATPACGDGACNGTETCSSCPTDCGACVTIRCDCRTAGYDNFCLLPGNPCAKSYCDGPSVDWVRGYDEYAALPACTDASAPTPSPAPSPSPTPSGACPCMAGVNNFCLYGPNVAGCAMTAPGGYCDPNGDGSFADADWNRGYDEYQAACP